MNYNINNKNWESNNNITTLNSTTEKLSYQNQYYTILNPTLNDYSWNCYSIFRESIYKNMNNQIIIILDAIGLSNIETFHQLFKYPILLKIWEYYYPVKKKNKS